MNDGPTIIFLVFLIIIFITGLTFIFTLLYIIFRDIKEAIKIHKRKKEAKKEDVWYYEKLDTIIISCTIPDCEKILDSQYLHYLGEL